MEEFQTQIEGEFLQLHEAPAAAQQTFLLLAYLLDVFSPGALENAALVGGGSECGSALFLLFREHESIRVFDHAVVVGEYFCDVSMEAARVVEVPEARYVARVSVHNLAQRPGS